jgi:hypothetical protein
MTQEKIRQAYSEYILDNGKEPESVYAFCKKFKTVIFFSKPLLAIGTKSPLLTSAT